MRKRCAAQSMQGKPQNPTGRFKGLLRIILDEKEKPIISIIIIITMTYSDPQKR
jgi:hypothetical protein